MEPTSHSCLFSAAFEAAGAILVVVDQRGRLVALNGAGAAAAGTTVEEAIGFPLWTALPFEEPEVVAAAMVSRLSAGVAPEAAEYTWLGATGNRSRVAWTFTVIRGQNGQSAQNGLNSQSGLHSQSGPLHVIGVGVDTTLQRLVEAAWRQQAETDPLTGLANRVVFERALAANLDKRGGSGCGLLFCDLDGFKTINDKYGHSVGDQILVDVADRLRSTVRSDDLVARIGGDEFVVILPAAGDLEVRALAVRIERVVRQPYRPFGGPEQVGISIGVCVAEAGDDPAAVLREADSAMYAVKALRTALRTTG